MDRVRTTIVMARELHSLLHDASQRMGIPKASVMQLALVVWCAQMSPVLAHGVKRETMVAKCEEIFRSELEKALKMV